MKFTVPLVPPSVNHYVKHTRSGRHYVTAEARAFKDSIAIFAAGQTVAAKEYGVEIAVFLGKGDRIDIDNIPKCCLDGLKDAGVIHSDAAITKLTLEKGRDWQNPRTEIEVKPI